MSQKIFLSAQHLNFLRVGVGEEQVGRVLYHIQDYGTAGALKFAFFGKAKGDATNGLGDTNMDTSNGLSAGSRIMLMGMQIALLPGANPVQQAAASFKSHLNDANAVLMGLSYVTLKIGNKTYVEEGPIGRFPAGFGLAVGAGGIQTTQETGADAVNVVNYASNGLPTPAATRKFDVPLPLPQQTKLEVEINFPSLITVGTAARLGIWIPGVEIRKQQ